MSILLQRRASQNASSVLTYAQQVAADTPAGWWKMDEASGNLTDSSGNAQTLTTHGSPTYQATGPGTGNFGITFASASSQWFDRTTFADLVDTFTLEWWYKRAATQGTNQDLFNRGSTTSAHVFMDTANKIQFNRYNAAAIQTSTTALTDTASWHHIVVTKNGATTKVYMDNVDVTGSVTNSTMTTFSGYIFVGSKNAGSQFLDGTLSNVAVYTTELSAARVAAHFTAMT